jgi:hypothetical protein
MIIIIISTLYGVLTILHESNHVSRKHNVAAVHWLQFMAHTVLLYITNVLYLYTVTFRSTCTVPDMAVFGSSLMSCFRGMLLRCSPDDFVVVSVAHIITGITLLLLLLLLLFNIHFNIEVPSTFSSPN